VEERLYYGKTKERAREGFLRYVDIKAVHHSFVRCAHSGQRGQLVPTGHQFTIVLNDEVDDPHHNNRRKFVLQADSPKEVDTLVESLKGVSLSYNALSVHHFHLHSTTASERTRMHTIHLNGDTSSDSESSDEGGASQSPMRRPQDWFGCLLACR